MAESKSDLDPPRWAMYPEIGANYSLGGFAPYSDPPSDPHMEICDRLGGGLESKPTKALHRIFSSGTKCRRNQG